MPYEKRIFAEDGVAFLRYECDSDPICGEDFCASCGDCLDCYGGDECREGGAHIWCETESGIPC